MTVPILPRERDAHEHDRLDEAAPDDDGLAAVLVGPHAPERDERHADDEDERREQSDERRPIGFRDAHLAQVRGQEREDLGDAEALDHRGDPEDDDDPLPVGSAVAIAVIGRGRGRGMGHGREA